MKRWLPHIGIVAGILIAVYAIFFTTSDEDRIRELLDRLETAVAVKEGTTNPVVRHAALKKAFRTIFTKKVSFEIPELTHVESGSDALAKVATQAPTLYQEASIDLAALKIEVDSEGLSAVAFGDALLTGVRRGGQLERDVRDVSIRLDKIDDEWRIVSVSVSERSDDTPDNE